MIELEPISERHLPLVQEYASSPSMGDASNIPTPYPENGAADWFERISPGVNKGLSKIFAITQAGAFRGVISLNGIDATEHRAELDYWVAEQFQNSGIATAAARLAVDRAHALGIETLYSGCLLRNAASLRVLEKSGFREVLRGPLPSGKFRGEVFVRLKRDTGASSA